MYGYEPPQRAQPGGCRDTLTLVRVAFEVLTPIVGAGLGALAYIALTFWLFTVHVALGVVPIALAGVAIALVARRDRRLQQERERESRWDD
jgi:type IV secretory pathway VirB6-like protein